jgi:hypothetical protein
MGRARVAWGLVTVVTISAIALGLLRMGSGGLDASFPAGLSAADRGDPIANDARGYALESLDLALKDPMARLEEAFEARSVERVGSLLTDDFVGSGYDGLVEVVGDSARLDSGASSSRPSGREDFLRELQWYFDRFDYIYESFFKVKHYSDGKVFTRLADVKIKQDLRGRRADGAIHQEFVYWKATLVKQNEQWKIARATIVERHQSAAPHTMFTEVTAASGLSISEPPDRAVTGLGNINPIDRRSGTNFDYGGVCLVDVDVDGDLDAFMTNAFGKFSLFLNDGEGRFRDEAESRGITGEGGARGAVFGDVDNDGDPDLFVCRGPFHHPAYPQATNLFYENTGGGHFREATERAGLELVGASMSAVFLDYDRDGFLDLYVANYGDGNNAEGESHPFLATNGIRNKLYRNRGDGTFEDVSMSSGIGRTTYWSYAVAVVDWNLDRYPDIYVANDFGPNEFWVNGGDGTFRDEATRRGIEDIGNGMGASFCDYDDDGDWDLYVVNMQSSTGRRVLSAAKDVLTNPDDFQYLWKLTLGNTFFENDGVGGFDEKAPELGIADCGWAWNADFADFDADGDQDLLVMNGYFSGPEKKDC